MEKSLISDSLKQNKKNETEKNSRQKREFFFCQPLGIKNFGYMFVKSTPGRMKKSIGLLLILFSLLSIDLNAQNKRIIDSLLQREKQHFTLKNEKGISGWSQFDTSLVKIYERLWGNYSSHAYEKAKSYALKMIEISKEINYPKGVGDGWLRVGVCEDELGHYEIAIQQLNKAVSIFEESKDSLGLLSCYSTMGVVYSKTGQYEEAVKLIQSSLEIAIKAKDYYGAATACNNLGIVFKQQEKLDKAIAYYNRAIDYLMKINEVETSHFVRINIGDIYRLQKKWDKAMHAFNTILKTMSKADTIYLSNKVYHSIGQVHFDKEEYAEAIFNFEKALRFREFLKDKNGIAESDIALGNTYLQLKKYDLAEKKLLSGLKLSKEINELEWQKNAYKALAELNERTGNFKNAFENYRLHKVLNDSLFNIEKDKKITQLEMSYHFKNVKDSLQIEHKKEIELSGYEIKKQKQINYILLVVTAIIILLSTVLIRQRNKLADIKKEQALEAERLRISRDLHDDLGSGLTGVMMMSEQLKYVLDNKEQTQNLLEKIATSSRQMVEQMGEIVWAINVKNDTLENLMAYTKSYLYNLFENYKTGLKLEMEENIPAKVLNGVIRRNIFLSIKEGINNAMKYASAGEISLHWVNEPHQIKIEIRDNGKGFDPNSTRRFGNGLKNQEKRIKELNGSIEIESQPGMGTRILMVVPV